MKVHHKIMTTAIMLVATAGYTLFITLSSNIAFILVDQMGASPEFLFSVKVDVYIIWIIIAWVSFLGQALAYFKRSKWGNDSHENNNWAMTHGLWIGTATLWHLSGLISPFISKSYVIN